MKLSVQCPEMCICHVVLVATTQPAPASAGEESEEDQQFRTIFQEIAGDVSRTKYFHENLVDFQIPPSMFSSLICGRTWKSQPTSWRMFSTESLPNVSFESVAALVLLSSMLIFPCCVFVFVCRQGPEHRGLQLGELQEHDCSDGRILCIECIGLAAWLLGGTTCRDPRQANLLHFFFF